MRTCTVCQETKPDICFHIFRHSKDGMRPYYCRMCRSCNNNIVKHVALLRKEHTDIPAACECCGRVVQRLHLDHCRETGEFRGFLCRQCNCAIGALGDNIEGVMQAIAYLRKCRQEAREENCPACEKSTSD